LPDVSIVRLEQTLYSEFPDLREWIAKLSGEKTEQTISTLGSLWGVPDQKAHEIALSLVDVGFFEIRGSKGTPTFWVPFLYRPALEMSQGKAE
jgi:hypothetical protein